MPVQILADCPNCNHANIRIGPPNHYIDAARPSGAYADPAIQCPTCHHIFRIQGGKPIRCSQIHPPPWKPPTQQPYPLDARPLRLETTPHQEPSSRGDVFGDYSYRDLQAACKARDLSAKGDRDTLLLRLRG